MIMILAISYPPLPLTIVFSLLIVIWLFVTLRQRYRTISLSGLAGELKLRIFARDPLNIPQRYEQLYLFKHGHARRARNLMIGHYQGRPIRAFDYLYETGLGLDRRTQQFSVVMVQADRGLPTLLIHPTEVGMSLYNMSGLEEVRLPQAQQSNYAVFCKQPEFLRDNLKPEMLARLAQSNKAMLELCEGMLAVYLPRRLKPAQYRQLMELAGELAEHFIASSTRRPASSTNPADL